LNPELRREAIRALDKVRQAAALELRNYAMNSYEDTTRFQTRLCDELYQLAAVVRLLIPEEEGR
jgi:hypothetical protein